MNAAGVRRLAGIAQVLRVVPVFREISFGVKPANRQAGDGGKPGMTVLVEIDASSRANGPLGGLIETRSQSLFRPGLLRSGRVTPLKDISYLVFSNLRFLFVRHDHPAAPIIGDCGSSSKETSVISRTREDRGQIGSTEANPGAG